MAKDLVDVAHNGAIRLWLWILIALVLAMITLGGATRLTDSGLSITEWQPIMGALPPLSAADWQAAFTKYRQTDEFRLVNAAMTLDEFKVIFWWEWAHRLLGRVIGLACVAPLAIFYFSGRLRPDFALKMLGVCVLVGLQGALGWYMVQSGLSGRVDVSQYRLAAHLGLAFVILGTLVWLLLSLGRPRGGFFQLGITPKSCWVAAVLLGLIFLQVELGALVAGLKAGLAYTTWPLMDGRFVPEGLMVLEPWYLNAFENIATVQFNHRMAGYLIFVLTVANAWFARTMEPAVAMSASVLAIGVIFQVALGVWTLLAKVPLELGLMHQLGAALVFCAAVWHLHVVIRFMMRARAINPIQV